VQGKEKKALRSEVDEKRRDKQGSEGKVKRSQRGIRVT